MEVGLWVAGWVGLDYEVDGGDVEAAGCDVGCEEDGGGEGGDEAGEILLAGGGRVFAVERDGGDVWSEEGGEDVAEVVD